MQPLSKIYIAAVVWLALSGAVFGLIFPKMARSLVDLQQSHQKQITELNSLQEQALGLQKMENDLSQADAQPVKLGSFFTADINLVREVQRLEDISQKTSMAESLTISGTADKAAAVQSASGLYQVPYTLSLKGSFPSFVRYLQYLENSYFISPVNGLTINYAGKGQIDATVLANFLIHK